MLSDDDENQIRPFEVPLKGRPASVAHADQIRSLDWLARRAKLKGRVSREEFEAIRARARLLVG